MTKYFTDSDGVKILWSRNVIAVMIPSDGHEAVLMLGGRVYNVESAHDVVELIGRDSLVRLTSQDGTGIVYIKRFQISEVAACEEGGATVKGVGLEIDVSNTIDEILQLLNREL